MSSQDNQTNQGSLKAPGASPIVCVLVLHWRAIDFTRRCLASLRQVQYANFRVLLVDNGSEDKDGKTLGGEFPEVEVLSLPDNLGFAGGCNAGIKHILKNQTDYIWLLNNDTTVDENALAKLIAVGNEMPKAAVLGAKVITVDKDGKREVEAGRGVIDFKKAKTYLRSGVYPTEPTACDWVAGSNLLLRTQALNEVGLFNDDYFLYFEDTDLCHRFTLAGWQCVLVPDAEVMHAGSASTQGKLQYWRAYYHTRNRFLFFDRYAHGMNKTLGMMAITSHVLRHAIVLPLRGEKGKLKWKAERLGWQDFQNKRFGKATCLDWCN